MFTGEPNVFTRYDLRPEAEEGIVVEVSSFVGEATNPGPGNYALAAFHRMFREFRPMLGVGDTAAALYHLVELGDVPGYTVVLFSDL